MGKTVAAFTMSLDGFIAGPNDKIGRSNIKRGNQTIIQMMEELNHEKSNCA